MSSSGDENRRKAYIYLGHGNEDAVPYTERQIVPEGTIVVSFTKPGEGLEFQVSEKIIGAMHENDRLFQDPIRNKEEIERVTGQQIRIYEAGSLMPALYYYPVNDMPGTRGQINFYQSGIYQLPIPFHSLYDTLVNLPLNNTKIENLYKGDLNDFLRRRLQSSEFQNEQGNFLLEKMLRGNTFEYTASQLIEEMGSGVHYFLNCRGVKGLRQKLQTFTQEVVKDIDLRKEALNSYIPDIQNTFKNALEYIHTKVIRDFKESLLQRTTANLPEKKLEGIRALFQSVPNPIENIYQNKDERKICQMIPKVCEKIRSIPTYEVLSEYEIQQIVDEVFQQENPAAFDRNIMKALILTPIQKKYIEIFNDLFGSLQARLPVTRQLSNAGQARYARTRTGGKQKKRRKTLRRRI